MCRFFPSYSVIRRMSAIMAASCLIIPAHGQQKDEKKGTWKGEFSLCAGSNFTKPLKEDVGEYYSKYYSRAFGEGFAKLGYTGRKFSMEGELDASSSVFLTGGYGYTEERDVDAGQISRAYGDASIKETNASIYRGVLSGKWNIDDKNRLDFNYQFGFYRDTPLKAVFMADTIPNEEERFKYGFTSENLDESRFKHIWGIDYLHKFDKSGRELKVSLNADYQRDDRYTEWNLGDGDMTAHVVSKVYRETPLYFDNSVVTNVRYTDKNFLDVKLLDLEFLLDLKVKTDLDRLSAANLVDGAWVDSTRYRENFDFYQFAPRPGVRAEYTRGIFNIEAKYQPEWYLYILNGDNIEGQRMMGSVAHFVDFHTSVSPGKYHKVTWNFNRDMTRPDYIQICWFDRSGSYANEIIRGNPDLMPSTCTKSTLVYDFKYRRFRAAFDLGYKYEFNKIESTFSSEVIDGNTYRINTWINSAKSVNVNYALKLAWEGKSLKAEVKGNYNYYFGWKDSGSETRDSDYSLNGKLSYSRKTWKFDVNARYQSAIIRNYTSMNDILRCDAKIEKSFRHFKICLEGRDLFDKAVEKETISDDETQRRLEVKNDNRRIFLLGVTYTF